MCLGGDVALRSETDRSDHISVGSTIAGERRPHGLLAARAPRGEGRSDGGAAIRMTKGRDDSMNLLRG